MTLSIIPSVPGILKNNVLSTKGLPILTFNSPRHPQAAPAFPSKWEILAAKNISICKGCETSLKFITQEQ